MVSLLTTTWYGRKPLLHCHSYNLQIKLIAIWVNPNKYLLIYFFMTITFKTNNIIANCTNVVWFLFNLCFKVLNSFYTIITFATISLLQISFCVDYKLMLTLTLDSIEKIFVWNSFFVSTLFYLGNWEILEIY